MYLTAEVHTASLFPAESKCSKPDSLAIWRMSKSYPKQLLKMYLINSFLNHSVNIGVLKTPDALQLVSLPICNWTFTITHTESIFMPREKAIHGVYLLYHKYDCVNHFLPNFPVWSTFFLADKPYNLQKIEILLSWKKCMWMSTRENVSSLFYFLLVINKNKLSKK